LPWAYPASLPKIHPSELFHMSTGLVCQIALLHLCMLNTRHIPSSDHQSGRVLIMIGRGHETGGSGPMNGRGLRVCFATYCWLLFDACKLKGSRKKIIMLHAHLPIHTHTYIVQYSQFIPHPSTVHTFPAPSPTPADTGPGPALSSTSRRGGIQSWLAASLRTPAVSRPF